MYMVTKILLLYKKVKNENISYYLQSTFKK
jgi:hypothetical protein